MQHNLTKIYLLEKIISILSYITMGIVGLIWFIIAYLKKRRLRYFLMYNVVQSMLISIFLTIIKISMDILFTILAKIPFLNLLMAKLYYNVISYKIIRLYTLGLSFTIFEFLLVLLLIYIMIGVMLGRIFYIPFLSNFMNKAMKNYN